MELHVSTPDRGPVDITDRIEQLAGSGYCFVFVPHTTCGLVINEAEDRLLDDIEQLLERLVPEKENYRHDEIDDNAHAHLRSMLLSSSEVLPYSNGKLELGTWQSVLLVESDGPRKRKIKVEEI